MQLRVYKMQPLNCWYEIIIYIELKQEVIVLNLGDKIKKLRKENNLSQEQLAEKLHVSRQAISKWESNKVYPDIENLILLRDIFNVTLDDLIIKENSVESKYVNKSLDSSEDIKWHNIKLNSEKEDDEEDDLEVNLILSGFIIGTAIGMITGNFMWASAGSFIGMGIGCILESIKKKVHLW